MIFVMLCAIFFTVITCIIGIIW